MSFSWRAMVERRPFSLIFVMCLGGVLRGCGCGCVGEEEGASWGGGYIVF
jgi:hypothetical protein